MNYLQYGIPRELVERVKFKMKNPAVKERVKEILRPVTKYDLQNPNRVRQLIIQVSRVIGESMTPRQIDLLVQFTLSQKIDPNNKLHLLRLWNMFR